MADKLTLVRSPSIQRRSKKAPDTGAEEHIRQGFLWCILSRMSSQQQPDDLALHDSGGVQPAVKPSNSRLTWIVIGLAIASGIFFRFTNLDRKVFWYDEVVTKIAISGRSHVFDYGRLYSKPELLQTASIDKGSSVIDVVRNLAMHEAEQVPFYYCMARIWSQLVGEGTNQLRLFSALVGVLLIGASYLLGAELFGNALAGGFTAALVAVSPFYLNYAQQARPYGLWMLTMVLAMTALLRALRGPTIKRWLLFSVALTITGYTHLLSVTLIIALCAWMLLDDKTRLNKGFWLSVGLCALCLLPWLLLVPEHRVRSDWLLNPSLSLLDRLSGLLSIFSQTFSDRNTTALETPAIQKIIFGLILFGASFLMIKEAPKRVSTFVIMLLLVPTLCMLSRDLLYQDSATLYDRFVTPSLLAATLCIAGTLDLMRKSKTKLSECFGASFGMFIVLGLMSCFQYSQERIWHQNGQSMTKLTDMINRAENPAVVSNADPNSGILMGSLLRDNAKLIFQKNLDSPPSLPFTDVFMVNIPKPGMAYCRRINQLDQP